METQPFGTWRSTLGADVAARGSGRSFAGASLADGVLTWLEYRPDDGGRGVVVRCVLGGEPIDLTPPELNVRTRVCEYGGGAWWMAGGVVFASDVDDSRLYRLDPGDPRPHPITPEPGTPHGLRYACGATTPDATTIVCERERHEAGRVHNELVALATDGSSPPRVIASGSDFMTDPAIDPAGRRVAWLTWDHPRMPWDGTWLWVANLSDGGEFTGARRVAGGTDVAVLQPSFDPDGRLHFCSDETGWWNLRRVEPDGTITQLTQLEDGEIGYPRWQSAMRRYAFLDDGSIACVVTRAAVDSLEILRPDQGTLTPLHAGWTAYDASTLAAGDGLVAFAASAPDKPCTLVVVDPSTGRELFARPALDLRLDVRGISVPRSITFPTRDGAVAHGFYYPPVSADVEGPADECAPLRVICHGGPTAHGAPSLSFTTQFFTQRGFGVVDVNHRGSSGYGRAYRDLLRGRWGEIDWRDCADAVTYLADQGEADADRAWIEGGSAGGYVVLCALVFDPTAFAAGVCLYGIADIEALGRETHKFESHYLSSLVGPLPEAAELYRARSPIHSIASLERPLLLLQGLDDKIVPPRQSEAIAEILRSKGIAHQYVTFAGEAHGFRRIENIRRSLELELDFVGTLFGTQLEGAPPAEPLGLAD